MGADMTRDLCLRLPGESFGAAPRRCALEESARIDSGRGVPLIVDHVAGERLRRRAEKMILADVEERRGGGERRDVTSELRAHFVRTHDHRERIPTHVVAKASFDSAIPGKRCLPFGRNRVDVRCLHAERDVRSPSPRLFGDGAHELACPLRPLRREHTAYRVDPFSCLLRVAVGMLHRHGGSRFRSRLGIHAPGPIHYS